MRFYSPALSINTLFMQFDMQTHFFFRLLRSNRNNTVSLPNVINFQIYTSTVESRERDNVWYLCDVVIYTIKCISTNCHTFDKREGLRNMFNIYIYEYVNERIIIERWIDTKLRSRM